MYSLEGAVMDVVAPLPRDDPPEVTPFKSAAVEFRDTCFISHQNPRANGQFLEPECG